MDAGKLQEPEPEPEREQSERDDAADDDEDYDDGVYEDEDGEGDEDGGDEELDESSDEEEYKQEEFTVNGTPMSKEQAAAMRAKSGFVPAAEGLDPSYWKVPHMRLSKFAGRPPTCVFGLRCASPISLANLYPRVRQHNFDALSLY